MAKSRWKDMTPEQQQQHREREKVRRATHKASMTPEQWQEVQRKRRAGAKRRGSRDVDKAREYRRSDHGRFVSWSNSIKARASKLNVPFNLDAPYLRSIYTPRCPVFDVAFEPRDNKKTNSPFCATVDRIVPELGYVKGNVIIVSRRANNIKSDATVDEIIRVADFYKTLTR